MEDIREKTSIRHEDVAALNFIRNPGPFVFRRHRLNGLRSHVMEVLSRTDLEREYRGVVENGLLRFPKARPLFMLRIFRRRFDSADQVTEEIERFKIVGEYLGRKHLAMSEEFVADYFVGGKKEIILCGLQEYVRGEDLDPWTLGKTGALRRLAEKAADAESPDIGRLMVKIEKNVGSFVDAIKKTIREASYVPDLAGVRNILVTNDGKVKLVDINNISPICAGQCPLVDDFDYPVCDKSIEALFLIESRILGRKIDPNDPVYENFMAPERIEEVARLHSIFRKKRFELENRKSL